MQFAESSQEPITRAHYEITMVSGDKIPIELTDTYEGLRQTFTDLVNANWRPLAMFYANDYQAGLKAIMNLDIILEINSKYIIRTRDISMIKDVSNHFMKLHLKTHIHAQTSNLL